MWDLQTCRIYKSSVSRDSLGEGQHIMEMFGAGFISFIVSPDTRKLSRKTDARVAAPLKHQGPSNPSKMLLMDGAIKFEAPKIAAWNRYCTSTM